MPRMNGRQLAKRICQERPEIRVLYMTGYTDDEIMAQGLTRGSHNILQKPFSSTDLANKVGEALQA